MKGFNRLFAAACLLALSTQQPAHADTLIADASGSEPLTGIAPLTVHFSAWNSTCDAPYTCQWHWDYGDGTGSLPEQDDSGARDATHHYLNAGTYTVTLTQTLRTPTLPRPTVSTTLVVHVSQGETLASYVNSCKTQLGFSDADIPTNLNCAKGVLFAPPNSPINDFFVHARVTDEVDLALACRWVNNGTGSANETVPPFVAARSIEMFLNNHRTNKTCFFKARDHVLAPDGSTPPVDPSINVVSPTVAAAAAPGTPAANYWVQPIELARELPCTDCHVAGPFIATPRIAPFLAQFGLLNNGHDTFGRFLDANNNPTGNYHIVGSTFGPLNDLALANNVHSNQTCAQGCHSIGYNSTVGNLNGSVGAILLPSITEVFNPTSSHPDINVNVSGAMAPTSDTSPYRWINRDTPGDGVEIETFTASKVSFPVAQYQCGVPSVLEAHAVGSTWDVSTANLAQLPDKLSVFNTREGLVCLNSDQPNGKQCNNYSVSYLCSDNTMSGSYDMDLPTFGGDHEERFNHSNVCTPTAATPNRKAIAIRAITTVNGSTKEFIGPNDRMAQFSPTGLVCRNSEQPNGGTCSNYVARYRSCSAKSQSYLAKLKNAWINPPVFGDRYLTTTATAHGSETRAQGNNYQYPSQDWIIEVSGDIVRLKDVWSGKYLTAANYNEQAVVVVNNYNPGLNLQQWKILPVGSEVRLQNVGTGRYLTVGNYASDPYFAPMYVQSLSNQNWASQRWVIQ